ncbi:MAG TPA: SPFH domain-containing protein, partial [Phycisphaerae bacterium]
MLAWLFATAVGLFLVIGPWTIRGFPEPAKWWSLIAGSIFLVGTLLLAVFTKLYRKPRANEAFVRTGVGRAKVILDGGSLVVPLMHRVVPVSLETMRLDVKREGADALITRDYLRADIASEFYIRVQPAAEDILQAARSLGEKSVSAQAVSELVYEKLVSALRSVAATKDLLELNTKRDEFAAAVQENLASDLRQNGLTLETVTISQLDQTPPENLNANNVFDAQGLRKITQITQEQNVERNRIERDAERATKEKNVSTRK